MAEEMEGREVEFGRRNLRFSAAGMIKAEKEQGEEGGRKALEVLLRLVMVIVAASLGSRSARSPRPSFTMFRSFFRACAR